MPKKLKTRKELDKQYKALIAKVTKLEKAVESEEGRVDQTSSLFGQAAEEIGRAVETHKERGIKATKLSDVTTLSEVRKILNSTKSFDSDITKICKSCEALIKDAQKVSNEFAALAEDCDATLDGPPALKDIDKKAVTALRTNADRWEDLTMTRVEGKANACITSAKDLDKTFEKKADSEVKKTGAEKAARDKKETDAYMADARNVAKRKGKFKQASDAIGAGADLVSLAALAGEKLDADQLKEMGATVKKMTDKLLEMKLLYEELNESWTNATDADREYVRGLGQGKKIDSFLADAPGDISAQEKVCSKANTEYIAAATAVKKAKAAAKKKNK